MAAIVVGSGGTNGEIWQDITEQLTWKTGKGLVEKELGTTGNTLPALAFDTCQGFTRHYDIIPVIRGEKYRVTGWVRMAHKLGTTSYVYDDKFLYALLDSQQRVLGLTYGHTETTSERVVTFSVPECGILTQEFIVPASASYLVLANLYKYFEEEMKSYASSRGASLSLIPQYSIDDFRLEKLVQ